MKKIAAAALASILGSLAFFIVTATTKEEETFLDITPPPAATGEASEKTPAVSLFSIPLTITAEETSRLLEEALVNPLYNVKGQKLDDSYGESDADVLVEKTGPVAVVLENNAAQFSLPFRFESLIRWKGNIFGISSSTKQEIFGGGTLRLKVRPRIDPDWKLRLDGELGVEWKKSPAITILGQKIGIAGFLSSILEERSGDLLLRAEEEINRSIRLKEHAANHWNEMQTPLALSDSPKVMLSIKPVSVSMPPFSAAGGVLSTHLTLKCILRVSSDFAGAEKQKSSALPPLTVLPSDLDPGFLVNLETFFPYSALGEYASAQELPTVDLPAGGQVTVEKLSFFGSGGRLVAAAAIRGKAPMGGTLKGEAFLSGKPVFSSDDQVLRIEEFDFDENSTKGLSKAASWIIRPMIVKAISSRLVFPVGELKEKALLSIADALGNKRLSDEMVLDGSAGSLSLEHFSVGGDGIHLSFSLGGKAALRYERKK